MKDLIDPMNEDTYDDRAIVHSNVIKTFPQSKKYSQAWDRIFSHTKRQIRKRIRQNVRGFLLDLTRIIK